MNDLTIYDFNKDSDTTDWKVVDDVVMGGRSDGGFYMSEAGHGVFEGRVSLENNGGFSSVRHSFEVKDISGYEQFVIRLKGDGKKYQFRAKSSLGERHSYVYDFQTNGAWQEVAIPVSEMYPTFRGRTLRIPNYDGKQLQEITFLIGNKKAENFKLIVDWIKLSHSEDK